MLSIPMIAFWILIFLGRSELGWKGVLSCVLLWLGLCLTLHFFWRFALCVH